MHQPARGALNNGSIKETIHLTRETWPFVGPKSRMA